MDSPPTRSEPITSLKYKYPGVGPHTKMYKGIRSVWVNISNQTPIFLRDRPFNLKGWWGLWFFLGGGGILSENDEKTFSVSDMGRKKYPESNL